MSLIVFNGSPRGSSSNSSVIVNWFLTGYDEKDVEILYLRKYQQHSSYVEKMNQSDTILMVFPLYVDGMPGLVKHFFEIMSSSTIDFSHKRIVYIIHSGFSNRIHCQPLKQYLMNFSEALGMDVHGVIIIPGSEGFRLMPPSMTKKKSIAVGQLGVQYKKQTPFDREILAVLSNKKPPSKSTKILFRILALLGFTNMYWNRLLKKNKAFKKRYDAPYKDSPTTITTDAYLSNHSS